jgi:DNA-binding CsgD family transcriptional regulator/tetratricopeptide (TPR) repeat protein
MVPLPATSKRPPTVAQDAILGREEELAAIAHLFDDDRSGPRAFLLEGDAGIGKTTLWREGLRLAQGSGIVLVSQASEAETRLSFSVLGDLLAPALDGALEELPAGQRAALDAALLLGPPTRARPDARAVSLAVLGVLRSLVSKSPITIAIDDVQWIDTPSARALAFALRRLDDEPVAVVATRRISPGLEDPLDLAGLPSGVDRLTVGPIPPATLGRLLRQRLGFPFAPPLVKRIHEASGGNPFFALEIGRTLKGEDALLNPGEPLPVPSDLRDLLRRRLTALPRSARDALLLAASSAHPTVPLVEGVEGGSAGLAEAESAGIVQMHSTAIEFTHPLFASTVYEIASARDRRAAHAALAKVVKDPEERARHLALCATGPSEEVAVALNEAAMHAEARGAPLAGAELYQLAAAITPPEETERFRLRRLSSAQTLFAAGDTRGARELIERMLAESMPGPARAQTMYSVSFMSWNDLPRVKGLLAQALMEVGEDRRLKALILGDMAWVEFMACNPTSAIPWADAAVELADEVNDPFALRNALAVQAMAGAVIGQDTTDVLERGISMDSTLASGEVTTPRTCLGRLRLWEGALDVARDTLQVELERYLEQGHEAATWEVRADLAEVEYRAGCWQDAAEHALEAHEIVLEAGWIDVLCEVASVKAAIEAATGKIREARVDGAEALSACERTGDRWNEIRARAVLGFLELSLGDAAAAHRWLAPAAEMTERMELREPGAFPFVPDEVEALVALDELKFAVRLTDRLDEQGRALDRPLALATAARCRGLISGARGDLTGAEEHLQRALREHARTQQPIELGRTLLVAGAVRRRMRKKRGARDLLERALTTFDEVGAPLWADRARRELARIGGRAPTSTGLTPTEAQIAHLVAEGRTNREVARTLVMSVHTVDAHLRRVYRKLQVRSRTELAHRL